jgi:ferredoxin
MTLRIILDTEACVGHGRCYSLAPDVYAADDVGHCELLLVEVPPALEAQARLGVDNCPERALRLEE